MDAQAAILATQLMNASSIPSGIPRIKATLEVVLAARQAGLDDLLSQAELELIGCYLDQRSYGKALEAFASTLTRFLHRPELYDFRQLDQLSRFFPRVLEGACKQPDVPLSLINHLLVGLEALHETLEPSVAATYYLRHNLREVLGMPFTQRSYLDRAIDCITPADSRSVGRAIDITQIEMAVNRRPEAALQVAWRMLTHEIPAPQKARLLRVILPALVEQKAWQVAWEAHLVAYEYDREESHLSQLSEHLRFLAVTGMWRRLVTLLERHLAMIRHAHDPWDLLTGLRHIVGSLDSLDLNGYGHTQLKVSLAVSQGTEGDARFLARLLRARALLECDQGFEALLLLGGLEQTKYPSVQRLAGEIRMLTSLARMQMNHDAADHAEVRHLEDLVFGPDQGFLPGEDGAVA